MVLGHVTPTVSDLEESAIGIVLVAGQPDIAVVGRNIVERSTHACYVKKSVIGVVRK